MVEKVKNKKIDKKVVEENLDVDKIVDKKDSKSSKKSKDSKDFKSSKDDINVLKVISISEDDKKEVSKKTDLKTSKLNQKSETIDNKYIEKIPTITKISIKKEKETINKNELSHKEKKDIKKSIKSDMELDDDKKISIKENGDKKTKKTSTKDNNYNKSNSYISSKKHNLSINSNIISGNAKNKNMNFIVNGFLDVSLLYKNFFHWNISKLIIFVWSILLGLISVVPLILIFLIYTFFSSSDVNIGMLIKWMLTGSLLNDFFWNIILLLIVVFYFIFYSYWNLLLINIYNYYQDNKILLYKKNEYFNFKKICNFLKLTIVNFVILFIPVLFFSILVWILVLFSGGLTQATSIVNENPFNYITISFYVFFILCFLFMFYLFYRIMFSYLVFSDKNYYDNKKNVFNYIKESFNKTKKIKSFFKFFTIIILFLIITIPIKIVWVALKNNVKILTDYSIYKKLNQDQKEQITKTDPYYFESLELEFKWFSDNELTRKLDLNELYIMLFSVFSFLFINWLFVMIYSSFYRREL